MADFFKHIGDVFVHTVTFGQCTGKGCGSKKGKVDTSLTGVFTSGMGDVFSGVTGMFGIKGGFSGLIIEILIFYIAIKLIFRLISKI